MVQVKTVAALLVAAGAIAPILAVPIESESVLDAREPVKSLKAGGSAQPLAKVKNVNLPKTIKAAGSAQPGAKPKKSLFETLTAHKLPYKNAGAQGASRHAGLAHKHVHLEGKRILKPSGSGPATKPLRQRKSQKAVSARRVASAVGSAMSARDLDAEIEARSKSSKRRHRSKKAHRRHRHRKAKAAAAASSDSASEAPAPEARDLDEVELIEREPILGVNHIKQWIKNRKMKKAAKEAAAQGASDSAVAAREDSEDLFMRYLEENSDLFEREPILGINHFRKWRQQRKAKKAAAAAAAAGESETAAAREVEDVDDLLARDLEFDLD